MSSFNNAAASTITVVSTVENTSAPANVFFYTRRGEVSPANAREALKQGLSVIRVAYVEDGTGTVEAFSKKKAAHSLLVRLAQKVFATHAHDVEAVIVKGLAYIDERHANDPVNVKHADSRVVGMLDYEILD